MAHQQQQKFFKSAFQRFNDSFLSAQKVLEIGSQDINGTIRHYFLSTNEYVGVDIGEADKVDYVIPGELLELPVAWADVVVTTECLEHAEHWKLIFLNMIRILKPSGLFLMTCASLGRAAHGTLDSEGGSSPFTTNYYKNLGVDDITSQVDLIRFFSRHSFEVESESGDLYFWGIRNANPFEDLLCEMSSAEDRLARAQGQLAQVISRETSLKHKFSELNIQFESKVSECEDLTFRLDKQHSDNLKIISERDAHEEKKREVQQKVEELRKQLEGKEGELQKVSGERAALAKESQEAQQAVEELKKQLEAKGGELKNVAKERDARAQEKAQVQQALEELKQQLKTAHTETKNMQEKSEVTLLQLHKVQEDLEKSFLADQSKQEQMKSIEDKLKGAQAELKSLVNERDEQVQQKEKAQRQVIKHKQHLEAKEERLLKLVGKRDALAKESHEAQKQLAPLKKQLEAKETELQKVTRDLHARNQELAAAHQQKEVHSKELLATQDKLNAKTAELQELEDEFHKLRLRHLRQRA